MMKVSKLNSYHKIALSIAENSPDEETKVGSLLINSKTGAVLGSAYNGFVRGGPDESLPKTRPKKYKYIIHSESNLISNSAIHGVSTDGCFVYCTLSPCINCLRLLYQAGISKVYFKEKYRDFDKNFNMKDLELQLSPIHGLIGVNPPPGTEPKFWEMIIKPRARGNNG